MRKLLKPVLVLLCGLGALTTLACGSGGSAPPAVPPAPTPPAALFSGTYFHQSCAGNFAAPAVQAWWGEVIADGVGLVTGGTLDWNDGLGALGSGPVAPFSFTVDAARRMTWPTGGPLNVAGGIAADGSVAVLGSIGTGGWPSMAVLVRKSGTFAPGALTGTYHLCGMYQTIGNQYAEWGTTTFVSPTVANESILENQDGVLLGPWNTTQSYSLAADGTMTYDFNPGVVPTQGGVLEGGELAVLTGGTIAAYPRVMVALVAQSSSASVATLSGTYHMVGFSFVPPAFPAPYYNSFTGVAHADGAGTLTTDVSGILNSDGAVGPFPPVVPTDSYTVAPDGTLTVTTAPTTLSGCVSPSGRFAVLAGGLTPGSLPQLWVLVR